MMCVGRACAPAEAAWASVRAAEIRQVAAITLHANALVTALTVVDDNRLTLGHGQ